MIKVDYAAAKENLNKYLNDVARNDEVALILGKDGNSVLMSEERYRTLMAELEKACHKEQ